MLDPTQRWCHPSVSSPNNMGCPCGKMQKHLVFMQYRIQTSACRYQSREAGQVQFQNRSSKQGWKKNPFTLIMTMVSILCARRVTRSFDLTSSICSKFENLHPSLLTEKLLFGQNSPPRRSPTARRCLMGRDAPEAKTYFL